MKAIICPQYGPPEVLRPAEVERPTPRTGQVLVRVVAASINAGDWHLTRGRPLLVRAAFGLLRPKHRVPGTDVAGRVEAVGANATEFQPGDKVFGDLSICGFGSFAEYACADATALAPIPAGIPFEQAAAVPSAGVTALQAVRDMGQLQAGESVLINGAGGGVGSFAVQIARALGAEVTAVCSTRKLELVRSLGPDAIIDYTQHDPTRMGRRFDLVVDAAAHRSITCYARALTPGGRYVLVGGALPPLFQAMLMGPWMSRGRRRFTGMLNRPNRADLDYLAGLLASGQIAPAITARFPLAHAARALRQFESGRPGGKMVLTVADDSGH